MILSLNGKGVSSAQEFQVQLYRHDVGTAASVEVLRGGLTHKILVTTVERPNVGILPTPVDPRENLVAKLGILGVTLDAQIAQMVPVMRVRSGVVVAATVEGVIEAKQGGLVAGDVIYALNQTRVPTLGDLRTAIDNLKSGDPVVLQLERRGALMYVAFLAE